MALFLPKLTSKSEVDEAIRQTEDKVLIIRFGRDNDLLCMQLDEILSKTHDLLAKMAKIYCVDVDTVPVYVQYFEITLVPATVFFFNGQHIKVDYGTPDHTKFIGTFRQKQDLIDLVEVIFRGAMKGKVMVRSPIDHRDVMKYELLYKDF